ncbi:MAG: cell division topological specificity factor MinE [Candidatus Eremiobacteraeota bacterium]|nr:cell division topological specificity factor MinE [Candidatus Eremiobacteraeota bacterium]
MLEFLTKFDFFNRIFKRNESRQTAKERLQLVLIHDRASVSPQVMEDLKKDLIEVISRYLEIDRSALEIGIESKDGAIALAANIPIKEIKRSTAKKSGTAESGGEGPSKTAHREKSQAETGKKAVVKVETLRKTRGSSGRRKTKMKRFTDKKAKKE